MKTDVSAREEIEINCYKDERNNWRYNCDKLQISGGFCPQIFAEELDKKYGSKTDMPLPAWLVSTLNAMKRGAMPPIPPKNDDFTSGWNAAIHEIDVASRGYTFPRAVTRPIERKESIRLKERVITMEKFE